MKKNNFELKNGEALVDVILQPVSAYREVLKAKGEKPLEIRIQALIDTGFTGGIVIPDSIMRQLKLKTRGWSEFHTVHDEDRFFTSYTWDVDLSVKFLGCSKDGGNALIETVASTAEFIKGSRDSSPQIIIGQEVLQTAVFVYKGIERTFGLTLYEVSKSRSRARSGQ